jgi:hypothetical protein
MYPVPIPIHINSGSLSLIDNGFVAFERQNGVTIRVGVLTIRIVVEPFNEEEPRQEIIPDPATLTVTYRFTGRMPNSPIYFFNFQPDEIGLANGYRIFFSHRVFRMHLEREAMQLDYSIYCQTDEHGNPIVLPNPNIGNGGR